MLVPWGQPLTTSRTGSRRRAGDSPRGASLLPSGARRSRIGPAVRNTGSKRWPRRSGGPPPGARVSHRGAGPSLRRSKPSRLGAGIPPLDPEGLSRGAGASHRRSGHRPPGPGGLRRGARPSRRRAEGRPRGAGVSDVDFHRRGNKNLPPPESQPATEPLSSIDHAWLRMDEPANLMIINGVLVLDEARRRRAHPERCCGTGCSRSRGSGKRMVTRRETRTGRTDPELDLDLHVSGCRPAGAGGDRSPARGHQRADGRAAGPLAAALELPPAPQLQGRHRHPRGAPPRIGDGMALLLVLLSLTDLTRPAPRSWGDGGCSTIRSRACSPVLRWAWAAKELAEQDDARRHPPAASSRPRRSDP